MNRYRVTYFRIFRLVRKSQYITCHLLKLRTYKLIWTAKAEDITGYPSMVQNKRAKRVVESELADTFNHLNKTLKCVHQVAKEAANIAVDLDICIDDNF